MIESRVMPEVESYHTEVESYLVYEDKSRASSWRSSLSREWSLISKTGQDGHPKHQRNFGALTIVSAVKDQCAAVARELKVRPLIQGKALIRVPLHPANFMLSSLGFSFANSFLGRDSILDSPVFQY